MGFQSLSLFQQKPCLEEKKNTKGNWTLPGKLQLFIWMGLDDAAKKIQHKPYGGEISVFAETVSELSYINVSKIKKGCRHLRTPQLLPASRVRYELKC